MIQARCHKSKVIENSYHQQRHHEPLVKICESNTFRPRRDSAIAKSGIKFQPRKQSIDGKTKMMDICRLTSDGLQPEDSLKMVEIDFQALCRICGALGENLTSVFGKRAADRLRERIRKYLQIDILAEDCLPTKVCDGCRETLDRFHELFEKCHRTDEKFRTMLSSSEELKEVAAVPEEEQEEEEDDRQTKVVAEEETEKQIEDVASPAKKSKESKRNSKQEEDTLEEVPEKKG